MHYIRVCFRKKRRKASRLSLLSGFVPLNVSFKTGEWWPFFQWSSDEWLVVYRCYVGSRSIAITATRFSAPLNPLISRNPLNFYPLLPCVAPRFQPQAASKSLNNPPPFVIPILFLPTTPSQITKQTFHFWNSDVTFGIACPMKRDVGDLYECKMYKNLKIYVKGIGSDAQLWVCQGWTFINSSFNDVHSLKLSIWTPSLSPSPHLLGGPILPTYLSPEN